MKKQIILFLFASCFFLQTFGAIDLIISGGVVPNGMTRGTSYPITIYVQNTGSTSTTTSFYINISINTSSTYNGSQTYLTDILVSGGIAAGQTKTLPANIIIPCSYTAGTRYILAGADATNLIAESSETNNNFGFSFLNRNLNTPLPNSPTNITQTSFQANWQTIPEATSYTLLVSLNNTFTNILPGYNNLNVGNTTSRVVSGLNCNTNYYYRVQAVNSCGSSPAVTSEQIATTGSCCTAPTSPTNATATQTTITAGQSTTLQVVGGALNSAPNWVWYTGGCGSTQIGTGTTLQVSPTTTTTYYVQASACGTSTTCRSVTITVTAGCTAPTSPTSATATQTTITSGQSTTLQVVGGALNSAPNWIWYTGGCGSTQIGTGATLQVSPITTTTYYVQASACGTSTICRSILITVTSGGGNNLVIDYGINATVIPPWQRQNDDYNGKVAVIRTGNINASWHLEIDVHNSTGTIVEYTIQYPPITTSFQNFNTASDVTLKNYSLEGKIMAYYAVLDNSTPLIRRKVFGTGVNANNGLTNITEKKWINKNIVYWRDPASPDMIKIPIKWDNSNPPTTLKIKRYGSTSYIMPNSTLPRSWNNQEYEGYPSNNILGYPLTIRNNSSENSFSIDQQTGYCIIQASNSNLYSPTLLPGDFQYEILGNNGQIDFGRFDLTKIGKIYAPNPSNKIIVLVGGILNETETSAYTLANINSTSPFSETSFSVVEYIRNNLPGYATWYIGQGNANEVRRNGYDLGIGLERIRQLNNISATNPNAEIVVVCHSKGGLDIKSLILGNSNSYNYNLSFNGSTFNFADSAIGQLVRKVVFLGTPHLGTPIARIMSIFPVNAGNSPGVIDLKTNSFITTKINQVQLSSSIKYCNLTGLQLSSNTATVNGTILPIVTGGDDVVPESSGLALIAADKIQLRQINSTGLNHLDLHKNMILSYIPVHAIHQSFMCYNGSSNLQKILQFVQGSNANLSCNSPYIPSSLSVTTNKSKVSNAKIYLKKTNSEIYYLGASDNDGKMFIQTYLPLALNDSIIIEASGTERIVLPIDKLSSDNVYNFKVATFASTHNANKVLYPTFETPNTSFITSLQNIQIKVGGQNIITYAINQDNSDTTFTPLSLINGQAGISLDTGYNKLLVKLMGIDTVVLQKGVFYFPDTLMNLYTRPLIINSQPGLFNSKVFVNDKYYGTITSLNQTFRVFKDVHSIKFSHFGYTDTIFTIDTVSNINLQMRNFSYSSANDSTRINFNTTLNPQYWKNVTVKNIATSSLRQISIKQVDDNYTGFSLKPQSRKFVFRNLINNTSAIYRTAAVLDQASTPDKGSVYYLIKKENKWRKILANQSGLTEYDPEVQKIAYDSLSFSVGETTQELALMKKQAPIIIEIPNAHIRSNDTLKLPISLFVIDPDSLKSDITISVNSISEPISKFQFSILDSFVYIKTGNNFMGNVIVNVSATHDFLTVTKGVQLKVLPPSSENILNIYPNPASSAVIADLRLTGEGKYTLVMYDIQGRLVKTFFSNKTFGRGHYIESLNLSNIPTGTYIFKLNDKPTVKFIKVAE